MATLSQLEAAQKKIRQAKILWLDDNRGILKRIQLETGLSQGFVSDVFHGRRSNADIEKRLRDLNAPGFDRPQESNNVA